MYERVSCDGCGAHKDAALDRTARRPQPCFVCGATRFSPVTRGYADIPELLSAIVRLTADLVRLDPSPAHLELAQALSLATVAHDRTRPESYPR